MRYTGLVRIGVDQSNKVEKTEKDTVLALSNEKMFAVIISRQVKRRLQQEFRRRGKPALFVYRTFIAGVVLLLQHASFRRLDEVTIDREYLGQERLLKSMFLEMWTRDQGVIPAVHFATIGGKSRAHSAAYLTMRGKRAADRVLTLAELRRLAVR